MTPIIRGLCVISALTSSLAIWPKSAAANSDDRASMVAKLCLDQVPARLEAIGEIVRLAAAGSQHAQWARSTIEAYGDKTFFCGGDVPVVVVEGGRTLDAATLQPTSATTDQLSSPFINLKVRSTLDIATYLLVLLTVQDGPQVEAAIDALGKNPKLIEPTALDAIIERQTQPGLRARLENLRSIRLLNDPDVEKRLKAISLVAAAATQRNLTTLLDLAADPAYVADPRLRTGLDQGLSQLRYWLRLGDILAVVFSGLSYASILFLASLGLAIIFGLMGVINLAQGELIMVGAYATYLVQQIVRMTAPALLDYYLLIAIPIAFIAAAGVGLVMEVAVIRHLYRRPLMTLLATWAVSLLLINTVRVAFGTQNLEFVTPTYLAGGMKVVGDFIITWNRLFAIVCALATFFLAVFVLRSTRLGLYIRAVTANRDMAGCVGVSVRSVDLLSFGIGSGLAGIAGLVLSPIYSTNPTMGSNFIVDAFMIVVLGGVGNIVGTLLASFCVGMINVAIEPVYGAVAAKVIVLLMIIVFIQFRPEGIFAIKGRR